MDDLQAYVEDVALYFEGQGLPRIAGRIVGHLLTCDPPHRSARELCEELGVSKGSVSTMTRLLVESGTIDRKSLPGDRTTYFVVRPESLERKLERRLERMVGFRPLAERGLALLEGEPAERLERLRATYEMYAFLEREMPVVLERWRAERARRQEVGS